MKFSGEVGFYKGDEETRRGVFENIIEEKHYTGDVLKENRLFQNSSDDQNDTFTVSNRISIYADLYFMNYWPSIRYVTWNGTKWEVRNVTINYPKATLEIGGVYHGRESAQSDSVS